MRAAWINFAGAVEGPPGRSGSITQRTYLAPAACRFRSAPRRLCESELELRVGEVGHCVVGCHIDPAERIGLVQQAIEK